MDRFNLKNLREDTLVGYVTKVSDGNVGADYSSYKLVDVLLSIGSDKYKTATEDVRKIKDKTERQKKKRDTLPAVRFSSIMVKRESGEELRCYTGLMSFDFDGVKMDKISVEDFKLKLLEDINFRMVAVWISSSGNGVRCVLECDILKGKPKDCNWSLEDLYGHCYSIILNVFRDRYGEYVDSVDPMPSSISSWCFLSYDKDIYITPILLGKEPDEYWNRELVDVDMYASLDTRKRDVIVEDNKLQKRLQYIQVLDNIEALEKIGLDVTNSYENWYKIAFALARSFGEYGRELFHRISRFHEKYNEVKCDRKYEEILTVVSNERERKCGSGRSRIGFGTLCRIIKSETGWLIPQRSQNKNKKSRPKKTTQYQENGKRVYVRHREMTQKELRKMENKKKLFDALPQRFWQQKLIEVANMCNIGKSTVLGYVKEEVENGNIKRISRGVYEKVLETA